MVKPYKTTNSEGKTVVRTLKRTFKGEFPPKSNFDKAHLKAYLKGHTNFIHGRDEKGKGIFYKTQALLYVDEIVIND